MADRVFEPKQGRIRDSAGHTNLTTARRILTRAGRAGAGIVRQRGHIAPDAHRRGTAPGLFARAGIMAPGGRRVIVRHATPGRPRATSARPRPPALYPTRRHHPRRWTGTALRRHQRPSRRQRLLRPIGGQPAPVPVYRLAGGQQPPPGPQAVHPRPHAADGAGPDTKLDWVAIDHFNTGHPHTHVVIRGRDDQGRDLVIARDYIGHGVRARAQTLMTLELGPESELERLQKLASEVEQERFTRLDHALLAPTKDGILVASSAGELAPAHQTMQAGRVKTLERLGLAEERRPGVWALDGGLEAKLRQLGDRADTYPHDGARPQAGRHRAGRAAACGLRARPIIGKVIAVGLVYEITDRQYVIVDGADGRVHYAELGRLRPDETPARGMIVSLVSDRLEGKPRSTPRLTMLSPVELDRLPSYDGPTWLDRAVTAKEQIGPYLCHLLHASINPTALGRPSAFEPMRVSHADAIQLLCGT